MSDLSENLVEIAAEQLDPAKWATIQIIKGGRDPNMTAQQAAEMIERVFREALQMATRQRDEAVKRLVEISSKCLAILRHKAIHPPMNPGVQERMENELRAALAAFDQG